MTVETLRKHKAEQATVRLQFGLGRDPNGLLFTDYKGGPIIPSTLSRRFARLVGGGGYTGYQHPRPSP